MRQMLFSALILAACAPVVRDPPYPTGVADTCQAATHGWLVGQPDTALERVPIMRHIRLIRPGVAVTMDFAPARINFDIGQTGLIERIWCG